MANIFSGLTAYVEEKRFGLDFYTEALQRNDVEPFVRSVGLLIPSVKEDSIKLPNMTAVAAIADGSTCSDDFDNGNDTTISQTTITLTKGRIADEICPHDGFEDYYTASGMTAGQKYEGIGAFENGILNEIMRHVSKRIAQNSWNGNASPDTWTFSGWLDQLYAATMGTYHVTNNPTGGIVGAGTTPTAGGAAGTDAAGVYNIVQALIDAAMNSVDFADDIMSGNTYVVMSPQDKEFLRQNYVKLSGTAFPDIAVGLEGLQNNTFAPTLFPGTRVPIYTQSSLTGQGTIILSRRGNQVMVADLVSDFTSMKTWYSNDFDKFRWLLRFKYGVGWRALNGSNVKYWGTTT